MLLEELGYILVESDEQNRCWKYKNEDFHQQIIIQFDFQTHQWLVFTKSFFGGVMPLSDNEMRACLDIIDKLKNIFKD